MIAKPLFTSLALILISISTSAQYSYNQKLGNLATIALPDTPKVKSVKGSDMYLATYKGVVFIAQVSDLNEGLRGLFIKTNVDSLYNSYIKGTIESTKGKLFYKNKLKINNQDGIEFGYKANLNGQKTYRYQHALLVNDTILVCGIWAADSLSKNHPHLTPFFNGFKVKSAEELIEAKTYKTAYNFGKTLAYLFFLAIPILLGFGVVMLLKRLIYGKKKVENPYTDFDYKPNNNKDKRI
jgi:hypothetical protein